MALVDSENVRGGRKICPSRFTVEKTKAQSWAGTRPKIPADKVKTRTRLPQVLGLRSTTLHGGSTQRTGKLTGVQELSKQGGESQRSEFCD